MVDLFFQLNLFFRDKVKQNTLKFISASTRKYLHHICVSVKEAQAMRESFEIVIALFAKRWGFPGPMRLKLMVVSVTFIVKSVTVGTQANIV